MLLTRYLVLRNRYHQSINIRTYTTSASASTPHHHPEYVRSKKSEEKNPPQPPLYPSNLIVLLPLFNGTVNVLLIGVLPTVGTNATTFPTPFTITFAYRCVLSPLIYAILIVLVVATELVTFVNVRVPPGGPPIYPMSFAPEQPEQSRDLAPEASVLVLSSASGVVSVGPGDQVPEERLRIQFTRLACGG